MAASSSSLESNDSPDAISREVLSEISACIDSELCSISCPRVLITNKVLLELNEHRSRGNYSWKYFSKWLFALSKTRPSVIPDYKTVRKIVIKISNDRKKLSKNKNKRDLNALLEAEFKFPKAGLGENEPSDQTAEAEIIVIIMNLFMISLSLCSLSQ